MYTVPMRYTSPERKALAALLEALPVRAYVCTALDIWSNDGAVDELVERIAKMQKLRAALGFAQRADGMLQTWQMMAQASATVAAATPEQGRLVRHVTYRDGLATPPPRRKTSDEHFRQVRKWFH